MLDFRVETPLSLSENRLRELAMLRRSGIAELHLMLIRMVLVF